MHCIRCKSNMKKNKLKGTLVDYCEICDAYWLDKGELQAIEKGMTKNTQQLRVEAHKELKVEQERAVVILSCCPKCQEGQIFEKTMDGVRVDYCNKCHGLYFDHGELKEIMANREQGFFRQLMDSLFS